MKDFLKRFVLRAGTIVGGIMLFIAGFYVVMGLVGGYTTEEGVPVSFGENISGVITMLLLFGLPGGLLYFSSRSARKRSGYITKRKKAGSLPRKDAVPEPVQRKPAAEKAPAAPVSVAVKCPNCGGMNTVLSGTAGECEYCGSPLQANP